MTEFVTFPRLLESVIACDDPGIPVYSGPDNH
jgi:hypothetical protein